MTTWNTIILYGLTDVTLTFTTYKKIFWPTLRRFFVFCQHTISTFVKSHEPAYKPSFAKELTLALAQRIKFDTLF